MSEGRRLLSNIPGVRDVFTGEAIKQDEKYRLCWMIKLSNKKVMKSFREHPDYIKFSKNIIVRPYAENLLSIDYLDSSSTG